MKNKNNKIIKNNICEINSLEASVRAAVGSATPLKNEGLLHTCRT